LGEAGHEVSCNALVAKQVVHQQLEAWERETVFKKVVNWVEQVIEVSCSVFIARQVIHQQLEAWERDAVLKR
jgi:hypothetical protein